MSGDYRLSDDEVLNRLYSSDASTPLTARPREAPIQAPPYAAQAPAVLNGYVGDNVTAIDPPDDAPASPPPSVVTLPPTPFQVIAPSSPSSSSVRAQVSVFSYLQTSFRPSDKLAINGLGQDFTIAVGNIVYLSGTVSDFQAGSATISVGAPWSGYPEVATYNNSGTTGDPFDQTAFYVLIAECVAAESSLPGTIFSAGSARVKVVQLLSNHLVLFPTIDQGRPLLYVAHHGAPQL